jgi:hypothetical protein
MFKTVNYCGRRDGSFVSLVGHAKVQVWNWLLKPCFHCRSVSAITPATTTTVLGMATLGGATQIGPFLLAKASKEGNIAEVLAYKLCQCTRALI